MPTGEAQPKGWSFNPDTWRLVLVFALIGLVTFVDLIQGTVILVAFYWVAIMISATFMRWKLTLLLSLSTVALSMVTGWWWGQLNTPQYRVRLAVGLALSIVAAILAWQKQDRDEHLKAMMFTDPLTGLPNRLLLYERLNSRLGQQDRQNLTVVMFIDLDNFRQVNDHFGHAAGDEMLKEVSRRLTQVVRSDDTVARLGGDEFVILCASVADRAGAEVLCQRLIEVLHQPFFIDDQEVLGGGSVGCVISSDIDADPERLVNVADVALRQVKEFRKGQYRIIDLTAAEIPVVEFD